MTKWPKISLVTPSFEQAPYLEQTLLSVLEQGYPNLEFIVMDGGSRDGSVEIIKRFESRLAYWRSHSDQGQYAAVLEGFNRSTGEILGWINSDDRLLPHSLQTIASIFLNNPATEWITGLPTVIDESGTATVYDDTPLWCRGLFLQKQYKFIQQESTFWRRTLWEKAGATIRTDSTLASDLELWVRFFRHADLCSVRYLFGAFRKQPDQKTAHRLESYCTEAEEILDKELEFFRQTGSPYLRPAPPRLLLGPGDLLPIESGRTVEAQCEELFAALEQNDFDCAAALANAISAALPQSFASLQLQAVCESLRGSAINGEAVIKNASFRFPQDATTGAMEASPPYLQRCIEKTVEVVSPTPIKSKGSGSLKNTGNRFDNSERDPADGVIEAIGVELNRSREISVEEEKAFLVSAIVSTYNSEALIRPCLDDLIAQTLFQKKQLEILVVDSGSQQSEKAIVQEYRKRFGNISYIRTERESIYAAWNRAIPFTRGKYITNANTDDSHREDALEKLAAELETNGDADLAYGDFINTSIPNDTFSNPNVIREVRLPSYQPATSMFFCVTGCHPMWRRTVFDRIGLFEPDYASAGDYEFLLRFVKAGLAAVHLPEVLSLFCENPKGIQFKSAVKNYLQFENIRNQYRTETPIGRLFGIDGKDKKASASAWTALGNMAMQHEIPWFEKSCEDLEYASFCFDKSLALVPENEAALKNLIVLKNRQGKGNECAALFARLPRESAERLTEALKKEVPPLVAVSAEPAGQPQSKGNLTQSDAEDSVVSREMSSSKSANAAAETDVITEAFGAEDSTGEPEGLLVSALVSTYNSERFFRGCLEDLVQQSLYKQGKLEIVVVDSGSEQGEREIIKEFQSKYAHIVYERTTRETLYAAWNRAVRIAKGRFLTSANTDDRHKTDALEVMVQVLEQTECGLVYADVLVTTVANETFDRNSAETVWQLPEYSLRQALVHCPYGAKYMWPRTLHDEVGLFDGFYTSAGDYECFLRLSKQFGAFHIDQALGLYFESPQNISYRDQNTVVREVSRFLPGQRKSVAMAEIYPFLREDNSSAARAAALIDLANQLVWVSVFPDLDYAEELLRKAEPLHHPFSPGIRNNLALIRFRQNRREDAIRIFEEVAPLFEAAKHNLSELKEGMPEPNLRLFSGPHPELQRMPTVVTPQGRRVPIRDYRDAEQDFASVMQAASKVAAEQIQFKQRSIRKGKAQGELPPASQLRASSKPWGAGAGPQSLSVAWLAPVFTPSGYAEEARNFVLGLEKRGFNLAVRSMAAPSEVFRQQMDSVERAHFDELLEKRLPHPIATVVHGPAYIVRPNPDTEYSIGRTMFEAEGLPSDWVVNCNAMDEIWVPTHNAVEAFREAGVSSKIVWIPEGINTEKFRPGLQPLSIPGLRGTVFLSVFEWILRKGWDVLLSAWAKAFASDDDVCLALRTYPMNTHEATDAKTLIENRIDDFLKDRLGLTRNDIAPIVLLHEQVPEEDLPRLFSAADAYVAPSRGEGWGRPQMAAMSCGLPTIATRWGGTQEFMTSENSLLIDYEMVVADERCEIPFYQGFRWADPSAEHLAELMRRVLQDRPGMDRIGAQAREDVVRLWGWDRAADLAAARLDEIGKEMGLPGASSIQSRDAVAPQEQSERITENGAEPVMSVLVSAYNSERFMRGCIEDLVGQTLFEKGRLEIIVVDSGSNENEHAIVREFQKRYPDISYIRTETRETVYSAWNRALEIAKGRYVTNGNTDDRHRADALEILATVLDQHGEFGLVYADSFITNNPYETFREHSAGKRYDWPDFNLGTALSNFVFGPHPVWRRSVHEEIGKFESSLSVAGDYEFCLRTAWRYGAVHLRETLGLFYQHSDTVSGQANVQKTVDETMEVLRKLRGAIPISDIYPGLSELKESDPGFAAAWFDFGNLCALSPYNDFRLALASYDKALEVSKKTPNLHPLLLEKARNNMGVVFQCAGDAGQARELFKQCSQLPSAQSNVKLIERASSGQSRLCPIQFTIEESMHPIVAKARQTKGLFLSESGNIEWSEIHPQVFWDVYTGTNGITVSSNEKERARDMKPRQGSLERKTQSDSKPTALPKSAAVEKGGSTQRKLRILFTMFGWNETGGGTLFPKSVAEELSSRGFEVSVFYAALGSATSSEACHLEETRSPEGVRLFGLYNRPAPFIDPDNPDRESFDAGVVRRFNEVLGACSPDVVHFHNFHGLTLALASEAKRRGLPTVYTPHNYHLIDPTLYLYRSDLSLWSGTDFYNNSELVARHPDKRDAFARRIHTAKTMLNEHLDLTLAISTRVRDLLAEFCGQSERIAVVHQVPQSTESLLELEPPVRRSKDPLRIGFLGGVMPHKGVHVLAAAAQRLPAGKAEVRLYGFSTDAYRQRLIEIDQNRVLRWMGPYDSKDLPRISSEVDIMVTPSVWEEGAGLVLLESLAMRCPVVAARIGGIPDFIVEGINGRLYRHDSAEQLARILEGLVRDREAVGLLSRNCHVPYRFGDYVDHIVSIYLRLAAGENVTAREASLQIQIQAPEVSSGPMLDRPPNVPPATVLAETMEENVDQLISAASRELQSGNLVPAREALVRLLELAPDNLEALISLGSVLYRLEDFEGANERFQRALTIKKDDPALFVQASMASLKLNRISDFETTVGAALDLDANNADALKLLGDLNFQENRFAEAGQNYARILSRDPSNVEVLLALGVCLFKGSEFEMAQTVFKRVLMHSPDNGLAKENLAVLRNKLSERGRPESDSDPVTANVSPDKSRPGEIQRLIDEAEAHYERGDFSTAKTALLEACRMSSKDPVILTSLGTVCDALGDATSARRYLEEALQVNQEDADILLQLALVELKADEIEAFEQTLGKALQVNPYHKQSLKLLADLNFKNDRLKNAAEIYTKILEHYPDELAALLPLGTCFMRDGDLETAKMVFQRALEQDPSCTEAQENLESIRAELGKGESANEETASIKLPPMPPFEPPATSKQESESESQPSGKKTIASRLQDFVDEASFFRDVDNSEASLEALERAVELSPRDTRLLSAVGSLHFTMGNYDASREKFRRFIELKPRDAEAYTRLAMACLKLDRIEEMEAALGIALEIDPKHREALKFLAKTNLESERVRDAGRTYAKLLEEDPNDVESLLALGLCFFKGGDLPAARMVYNRVLEYDPNNPTAHENLAQIETSESKGTAGGGSPSSSEGKHGRQDDGKSKIDRFLAAAEDAFGSQNLAAARNALKSALELAPDAPEILAALGSLHFQLGEMSEARDTLLRLVDRAPAEAGQWVKLALAHYQLKEIEEFEKALAKALELDPDHLEALRLLAHLSFNHGNIQDAAQTYGRILKQLPDDLEVMTALGVCFFKTGDNEAAKMMFERVLEINPGNALALENLSVVAQKAASSDSPEPSPDTEASVPSEPSPPAPLETPVPEEQAATLDMLLTEADQHATAGDLRKACDLLQKAVDLEPDTHEFSAALGSLLHQLGDWQASFQALNHAVALAPDSADYQTRLAISLLSLERIPEFEAALAKSLELDANHRPALRLIADLNFRQGNFKDAAHTYHRLLLLTPDDVEVMLPLAVCFYKHGDTEAAKMIFDRILVLDPNHQVAKENRSVLDRLASPTETEPVLEKPSKAPESQTEKETSVLRSVTMVWEGSQFVHHSLALVNRELCLRLLEEGHSVSILPYEPDQFGLEADPRFHKLASSVRANLPRPAEVHLRHQWPLNTTPPAEGRWVVIQPWEYGSLPKEWIPIFRDQVDEIWVPSSWVRDCYIRSGVPAAKVFVVPNGVNTGAFHPEAKPLKLATKKRFKFLYVGGLIRRKGVDVLLNAYLRRFSASDDVCLVVKSFGGELYRDEKTRAQIRKVQKDPAGPEILLLNEDFSPEDLPGLYTACDCLVHTYRGEGFGLPILEAMACGLPTIVTAGGASDDFATDEVAYRIPAIRKNLGTAVLDMELTDEGWLLEPDLASVEKRMGWVLDNPDEAARLGALASKHACSLWSWDVAAKKAEVRLIELTSNSEPPVRFRSKADPLSKDSTSAGSVVKTSPESENLGRESTGKRVPKGRGQGASGETVSVVWEGPQFSHHSLALINRELCLNLIDKKTKLSVVTVGTEIFSADADSRFQKLKDRMGEALSQPPNVHIRHQWPMRVTPPKEGFWVVMQPWEYGAIPKEWVEPLRNHIDEIWAYTNFVRESYIRCGIQAEKIFVIPCGIHPEKFHPNVQKAELATKKKFKFLFVGGTIMRKGPDLLLGSFLRLFSDTDDVCLVIKDFGSKEVYKGQTIEELISDARSKPGAPEILHLTEDWAPEQLPGLYAACDCLVHPYRGEGFALPVLEAMAVGLPVIVTAGGSTDDFAPKECAYQIPAKRAEVPNWAGPELVAQPTWLEPDPVALDDRMLYVFKNREEARKVGVAASDWVLRNWTWECASAKVEARLNDLSSRSDKPLRFRTDQGILPVPGGEFEIVIPVTAELGSLEKVHEFVESKKYLKAWNAALEAISIRPFHPDAYMQMVDIALRAQDSRQAYSCAQRLIKMTPNWEMARKIHTSLKSERKRKKSNVKWTPLPRLPKKPRVSVCMIAKNEEDHIGRCLASVKGIADQIVLVDTGSTDKTVEIAKEHGAEVYYFEWNDNFSDARNKALEYARGDWVLSLDADEELSADSQKKLAADMSTSNVLGYRIPICNLHESDDSVTYVPRLFRNAPALFFVGRVHEQIYASVIARKAEWVMDAVLGTAKIMHHGYDPGLVKRRQKIKRNLRLLERAIEEMPNESALVMNYGLDLVNDGRLEDGLVQYRRAFRLMEPHPADVVLPEVRERLMTIYGVHLLRAERFEEVVEVMTSRLAKDCGPTASLHFLAGAALMKLGRDAEAIPQLNDCLEKRHEPTLTPPCQQIFKGGPRHLLAECFSKLEQHEDAERSFKEALDEDPESTGLLHDYAYFLHQRKQSLEALQVLHSVLGKGIDDLRIWHLGSLISNSRPEFIEFALDWTAEAIKFYPDHSGISLARGEALMKSERLSEAIPYFKMEPHAGEPAALAAIILAELVEGNALPAVSEDQEPTTSREFIAWYRRLLAAKAQKSLMSVNAKADVLRETLPTAGKMLSQALSEAGPLDG